MSNLLDVIVPFKGQHFGKPLGLILRTDRGWVEWMAKKAYNRQWREKFVAVLKLPEATTDTNSPTYRKIASPYPLSAYQQAIVDAYTNGDSIAIEARAGSGKTFMLRHLANMTTGCNVKIVAFNVHIAKELSEKLKDSYQSEVQTIHAAAYGILSERLSCELDVDDDSVKYRDIIREMIKQPDDSYDRELARVVRELTQMARLTLTDYRDHDAMEKMADVYNKATEITFFTEQGLMQVRVTREEVLTLVEKALDRGIKQADRRGYVDFDDMLYLVASRGYMPSVQADIVMADEGQDFNAAQIKIFGTLGKPNCQKVVVGDPFQAIQGFAYAAYDSFERLCEALDQHKRLTMPITYRCPASHVRLAQGIVPDLLAQENAPEGVLEYAHSGDFLELVKPGDLVICRTTAPLIKNCIKLLQSGMPAFVRGRAIHKELIDLIKKAMNFANVSNVLTEALGAVQSYKRHQLYLLEENDASVCTISNFTDRTDCCEAILRAYPVSSLDELSEKIKELTVEPDDTEKVVLATGHRSKGDENKRVFVLNYSWLPFKRGDMSDEQASQEDFVHYVILTRSKEQLYLLDDRHQSILKKKTKEEQEEETKTEEAAITKPEEAAIAKIAKPETEILVHVKTLVAKLAKIVNGAKYKGRHTDIKQLTCQIQEILEAL